MRLPGFQTWLNMLFLAAAVALPAAAEPSQLADVILVNPRIYTVNPQQAWVDAIAVQGDKIIGVGERAKIETYRGKTTKVIDAQGRLVLPGFTECAIRSH